MKRSREVKKLWNMKTGVMTIVIGALGMVLKGLENALTELEVGERIKTMHC